MKDALGELHPSRNVARRMHELETDLQRARMHLRRHSKSPDTVGRWGLEQPAEPQQEEGWFITYLDMMTLLLVVMIVMLAFSGTLKELPGRNLQTSAAATGAAAEQDPTVPTVASAPAPAGVTSPEATADTHAPTAASPAAPAAADIAHEPPGAGGAGLLPGGAGLLPRGDGGIDALAVSEPYPGSSPMDVGPLPRDATVVAASAALPSATHGIDTVYPGWNATDLAASFIGPPRPPSASPTEDTASGPAAHQHAAMAAPVTPDAPSEGESLAAGLSLGELGGDVEIVVNERSVSFRVNSEILFDSSQADLSRSGLSVLRRIVDVLSKSGHEVTVEGHTDSVPVRRNVRYPSNWELSSSRAGSVVRYLQANGIDGARLKAIGYADTRPIGDNHTPDGRARNRRVELVIEKR